MNEAEVKRADEGFTVAELVIAAAILFFVLTAMIGLMGAASQMNVMAKERSVLTNATASYLDELRGQDWASLATPGSPTVMVVNGVHVTIYMTVETKTMPNGTPYLKVLRVSATANLNGQDQTYTTRVAIRNPNFSGTLKTDPDVPIITWNDSGYSDAQVVFSSERLSPQGTAINLGTVASSPGDLIANVKYSVGAQTLNQVYGGSAADFTPLPPVSPYSAPITGWDSRQVGDGLWTVSATAKDNSTSARTTTITRKFIVDNVMPGAPGVPSGSPVNGTDVNLTWDAAQDGGGGSLKYYASRYYYVLTREPTTGGGSDPSAWAKVNSGLVPAGTTDLAAITNAGPFTSTAATSSTGVPFYYRAFPPFSRVWIRVYAGSPRFSPVPLSGYTPSHADCTSLVVTRPELLCETGHASSVLIDCNNSKTETHKVTLWVSKPQFPSNQTAATYSVEYYDPSVTPSVWAPVSAVPGTYVLDTSSDANAAKIAFSLQFTNKTKGSTGRALQYRVTVNGVSSTGYGGTTAVPARMTNAAGYPSTANAVTAYMTSAGW